MSNRPPRPPRRPPELFAALERRQDELAAPLRALMEQCFPEVDARIREECRRDIGFSLFFLERAQTAPEQTSATLVRDDLRRLSSAISEVQAAMREMTPQSRSMLLQVLTLDSGKLGLTSPNKFPLNVVPIGDVPANAWRQFRRACLGARRYVIRSALRNTRDGRPPDVADLNGLAVALLPVWERCLDSGGKSHGKHDPFNGSPKASRAHQFIAGVLSVVGMEAGRVAIQRAARHAAKMHGKDRQNAP